MKTFMQLTNVLIIGATGSVARVATRLFLGETEARLTLYSRSAHKLTGSDRVRLVDGDVFDASNLREVMQGQDVVFASLAGDLARMAKAIVDAMHDAGVRRLIFISSMGIYGEVPGERYGSVLDPYRDAAEVIEASDLDYTILRPGWFTNADEIDYEITHKGEPFRGHDVSRKSLAALIVKLATTPDLEIRQSLGVSKP